MKKLLAVLSALVLLTGCSGQALRYAWAGEDEPAPMPPTAVRLVLPRATDEIMDNALLMLESKLVDLAGGSISLVREQLDNPLGPYNAGEAGVYLLTSEEMEQLDPTLAFARLPFLFPDRDKLMGLLNAEQGMVRGSRLTAGRIGGEILGVYYGGTSWVLGRGRFYDEVGFLNGLGLLEGQPGNSIFSQVGAEAIVEADAATLQAAMTASEMKFCELLPGMELLPQMGEHAKSIELTNHRYTAFWLVLRDEQGTLNRQVIDCLKEAFAYTVARQDADRVDWEENQLVELENTYNMVANRDEKYTNTYRTARQFYRANYKELGFTQQQWEKLLSIIA